MFKFDQYLKIRIWDNKDKAYAMHKYRYAILTAGNAIFNSADKNVVIASILYGDTVSYDTQKGYFINKQIKEFFDDDSEYDNVLKLIRIHTVLANVKEQEPIRSYAEKIFTAVLHEYDSQFFKNLFMFDICNLYPAADRIRGISKEELSALKNGEDIIREYLRKN